jgi:hypothetical protein
MAMVAKGETEIGLTFVSEMEDPGVELVGSLPRAMSTPTGARRLRLDSREVARRRACSAEYLSSSEAAAAYKSLHMQPGK